MTASMSLPSPPADEVAHISRDAFRSLFRTVPTAVSVVATRVDDTVHATTISAFTSLSAEPALVMLALKRSSLLLQRLRESGRFGLSVLADDQHAIALTCASSGPDQLTSDLWHPDREDPCLANSAAWCACRVESLIDGGDHVIVIARIIDADHSAASPLVHHAQGFHALGSRHA